MRTYRIYRFGRLVREINGDEVALLTWIQNNVPATSNSKMRSGDVRLNREHLYEDVREMGYSINSKK